MILIREGACNLQMSPSHQISGIIFNKIHKKQKDNDCILFNIFMWTKLTIP